jgi:hypothetical protein
MQLLGHNDIAMTMRYLEVTQEDLQREFHRARHNAPHCLPPLSLPEHARAAGLPAIQQALAAARHLLEMHRRCLTDERPGASSNFSIGASVRSRINSPTSLQPENEERLAGQSRISLPRRNS